MGRNRQSTMLALGGGAVALTALALLAVGRPGGVPAGARTSASPATSAQITRPTAVPTGGARSTPSPIPRPTSPAPVVDRDAGYWLTGTGRYEQIGSLFGRSCSYDFCAEGVRVFSVPAASGITAAIGDQEVVIEGATLDAIAALWRKRVVDPVVEDLVIDGQPALLARGSGGGTWALTFFGGRLFGFGAHSMFGPAGSMLTTFLDGFHFIVPGCWLLPCQTLPNPGADSAAIAQFDESHAEGTFRLIPNGLGDLVDDLSTRSWRFVCNQACYGELRVAIGTAATGPLVNPGEPVMNHSTSVGLPQIRISGSTVQELEEDWYAKVGWGTFERVTIDGVPATKVVRGRVQYVFVVWRGMVIAFTSVAFYSFDPWPGAPLAGFEPGFSFIR